MMAIIAREHGDFAQVRPEKQKLAGSDGSVEVFLNRKGY
jgi:hypothetical protein